MRGVFSYRAVLAAMLAAVVSSACSDLDKAGISNLLDARDRAISHRSVSEYSAVIAQGYNDKGRSKVEVVAQMISLFDKFEKAEMNSFDRDIRALNEGLAQCEQSYKLKVFANGQWRQIVQREQLTLARTDAGWKITAGL